MICFAVGDDLVSSNETADQLASSLPGRPLASSSAMQCTQEPEPESLERDKVQTMMATWLGGKRKTTSVDNAPVAQKRPTLDGSINKFPRVPA